MILTAALVLRRGIMVLVVMAFMVATSLTLSALLLYSTNRLTDQKKSARTRQKDLSWQGSGQVPA
jgi:hypothetical protein